MKPSFEFPIDTSGQWDGFNDPGIEHFTGNPFQHLGREVPQNTLDAATKRPTKLHFVLKTIETSDIPDVKQLSEAISSCVASAKNENNEKASTFFLEAQRLLRGQTISVLQISDSNTTGVRGPCVNGSPFFAMLKATGQSRKANTSTGSFGIGKFAPYTVSGLRTVFLSTVWQDEHKKWHHYVQGKSILMSFVDKRKATHRGTGFWGISKECQPVVGLTPALPNWLRRVSTESKLASGQGTTLSILAFTHSDRWQQILAANILENFFGAISQGALEVFIDEKYAITSTSLGSLANDDSLRQAISQSDGEPEKFTNVASYLDTLRDDNENVIVRKTENLHLGECELRLIVAEGLPKRVAVLRNGMLITESLSGLKRFGEFKDFVAVLECKSSKGLALLRAMEPPRHDTFEPERLQPKQRSQGRVAIREIATWVREMLRQHAQNPVTEQTELNELADFFADESADGKPEKWDENPSGNIVIRSRAIKFKKPKTSKVNPIENRVADTDSGDGAGDGFGNDGLVGDGSAIDSPSSTPRERSGGADVDVSAPQFSISDVRAVITAPTKRRIMFTPGASGRIRIQIQDSGADSNQTISILSTTKGRAEAGTLVDLPVTANTRCSIEVELSEPFSGTIRVVASAI